MRAPEELDELPKRQAFHVHTDSGSCKCKRCNGYRGGQYPYRRVERFLISRVGGLWSTISSEFIHLEWIPSEYRAYHQLTKHVKTHTFKNGKKIMYFDTHAYGDVAQCIDDSRKDILYVHPVTFALCFKERKKTQIKPEESDFRVLGDYHQIVKKNGKWYEVKGEPVPSKVVVIDGLHYAEVKKVPTTVERSQYQNVTVYSHTKTPDKHRILDGKILIPVVQDKYWLNKPIGPRDRMIEGASKHTYFYSRNSTDYNSVKITVYRELNTKELKRHGVKNDPVTLGKQCPQCGAFGCALHGLKKL